VPVFTWTGFYIGANVGAGWSSRNRDGGFFDFDRNLVAPGVNAPLVPIVPVGGAFGFNNGFTISNGNNDVAILGGIQAGFNWQMAPGNGFVFGVEADIQAVGNNHRDRGFFGLNNGGFGTAVPTAFAPGLGVAPGVPNVLLFNNNPALRAVGNARSDWFGTARVRLGYAWDRFMLYGTGGVAFKDDRHRDDGFIAATTVPAAFFVSPGSANAGAAILAANGNCLACFNNNSNNNVGWAAGIGGEWAFTNNLSAKIEYLHLDFSRNRNNGFFGGNNVVGVTNTGAPITSVSSVGFGGSRPRANVDLVRVGLNFRFGGFGGAAY